MLRRLLGGPDAGRNAVLAVLPILVGAILLLGGGDRPSAENTILETTQGPAWPQLLEDLGPTSTSVASATSAAEETAGSPSPTAEGSAESTSTTGSPWTPSRRTNATSGSGSAPASDGEMAAASTGEVEGDASSGAGVAMDAPAPTGDSRTTADPTADATPTAGPTSTSPASPTRAAETITTTTTSPPPPPPPATGGYARDRDVEAEVVPLTNQDRSAQGLGALSRNACLDSVASGYAEQMARSGVLAHNSGAGPAIQGCRPNSSWGDNVGTAAPCDVPRLEREWMASPGHRRNILTGAFQHIGVGAWTDEKGGCWVQVLFSS